MPAECNVCGFALRDDGPVVVHIAGPEVDRLCRRVAALEEFREEAKKREDATRVRTELIGKNDLCRLSIVVKGSWLDRLQHKLRMGAADHLDKEILVAAGRIPPETE